MNMNKTNKKVSTLAATVAVATAFCGLCAGVATTVKAEAAPANVQTSAAGSYKVILNPGWNFDGGQKKLNTITDAGATKADAATYYADNAYIANYSVGENLPTPTSGRSGMQFLGWRYSKDGELITVDKMPAATDGDVYLYANWKSDNLPDPDPNPNPNPDPDPDPDPDQKANGVYSGDTKLAGLTLNPNASNEYWMGGSSLKLAKGQKVSLSIGGKDISAYIERNSSGIDLGNESTEYAEFTVTLAGDFDIYLHKNTNNWSVQFVVTVPVEETTVTIPNNAAYKDIQFGNGTVRLYIQDDKGNFATNLSSYNFYMWDGNTKYFGEWPGTSMSQALSTTKQINANINFIVNNKVGDSGIQTRDLKGLEAGGTYLVTFVSGDDGKVEKIKVA